MNVKFFRIVIASIMLLMLSACKEPLYSQLNEVEANEIIGALLDKGINANKVQGDEGTWKVMIDRSDFGQAVAVLRQSNYPRQPTAGLGVVFRKDGLISSPTEERARLIYALSQELSGTLSRIDGVLLARVHVAISPADPLTGKQPPSSVSVFIKHRSDTDISRFIPQIKTMVMNAIEGATYDGISVALFPSDPRFEEHSTGNSIDSEEQRHNSKTYIAILAFSGLLLLTIAVAFLLWQRQSGMIKAIRLQQKNLVDAIKRKTKKNGSDASSV